MSVHFLILETEDGLVVDQLSSGQTPEELAAKRNAVVVDAGPYPTFDDAYDALLALQATMEETED